MKAAVLHEAGKAPTYEDFRDASPEDGGAAGAGLAAGLNPVDATMAKSGDFPRVVGNEGVALVNGKRAYFERSKTPFGSYAERAVIDPDLAIPLPDALSDANALTIGISGVAPWMALSWRAKLQRGERVLVLGASGNAGRIAIQAAKLLGASRVVAAGRDRASLEPLHELGADATVVLEGDASDALREASGGDGFDVVFDPLFGKAFASAVGAAANGARIVTIGMSAGDKAEVPGSDLVRKMLSLLGYSSMTAPAAEKRSAYEQMMQHVIAGELKVSARTYPLAEVAQAWEALQKGSGEKIVVVP